MPNKISQLYADLKSAIVGTKTQKVDTALDKAVKDIISYKSNSGRNGYIDLVKTVISKSAGGANLGFTGGGLFSSSVTGPASFGQGARLMRYRSYEAIVSNINYAHRALAVITDNILSPDDITKVSLDVKPKNYLEDETPTQSRVKRVKEVIKTLKLEKNLNNLVRNTLQYGDYFCEIADAKVALTTKSLLTEGQNYQNQIEEQIENGDRSLWSESLGKDKRINISIDYSSFSEQEGSTQDQRKRLKNLNLAYHKGNYIIKLQSGLFPVCFGYLVFPQVRGIGVAGASLEDDVVNNICISILKDLEKKLPQMSEFKDNEELKDILKYMVRRADPNQALEIRYVPPNRMVHFQVPSEKYYPYGESIFDSSQYSAKVLIALETALAVQRLSRSTEKRKIAVEVGLPRDARQVIESMKEEFRKRKVSLDSFGTVDTIPSMITTFEDVYIPQRDGKPFVDISTFNEGNVDIRSKVDELKFMRDQLTASWGVPPSFIGIEENLSNKAALSEENILFARTIIGHQKYLSMQLTELIHKVFEVIDPEEALLLLDNVDIHLPPPKSLQYEREARYINELTGLIESLERIGIPKEYSKRKYLSHFDWEEIKKYDIDQKVETTLDPTKKGEDEMGGMGGGFGGGTSF